MRLDPSESDSSDSSSSKSSSGDEMWHSSSSSDTDESISSGAMSALFDDTSESDAPSKPKRRKRVCIDNYCDETVQNYSDKKFARMFRLPRDTVNALIKRYAASDFYESEDRGIPKIPPHHQIYCFLWFVGHQTATYEETADRFNLSTNTVFNIITRVADFINSFAPDLITWPTEEEAQATKDYYEAKHGISGVMAHIDGTHIAINRPSEDADSYYNRKAFFSLQMQIICDHKHKILDFLLGWPGSVHDARVHKRSRVQEKLAELNRGRILADSAYPCTKYMIPPFKENGHLLPYQKKFNKCHSFCRVDVEHTIGILKQRFRILYHVRLQPGMRRLKVIKACVVLHNMVLAKDLEFLEPPLEKCTCETCQADALAQAEFSPPSDDEDNLDDDDEDGPQIREQMARRFMD